MIYLAIYELILKGLKKIVIFFVGELSLILAHYYPDPFHNQFHETGQGGRNETDPYTTTTVIKNPGLKSLRSAIHDT